MHRHLPALLLATALTSAGCVVTNNPSSPCEPNPCHEANRTTCMVEAEQARCVCDSGFVSRPNGACEPVSAANCPEHFGDAAEPDDCTVRARALPPGGAAKLQTIEPSGDYDFFQFEGTARHVYILNAKRESASLLPRVDVYDRDGKWLGAAEGLQQAELAFKATANAPYFARVSHSPMDPSVATGGYALTLVTLGAEDHGDSASEATSLSPDAFGSTSPRENYGRFELPQDADWFAFSADPGTTYRVEFDPTRGLPQLAVFASGNYQEPVFTAWSRDVDINVPANVSGTVYIALYPAQGQSGSYAFRFFH